MTHLMSLEEFETRYNKIKRSYDNIINKNISYYEQIKLLHNEYEEDYDIIKVVVFTHQTRKPYELITARPVLEIPLRLEYIHQQFVRLASLPQPEQKSAEWFAARHQRITASSGATALHENKYESQISYLVQKCEKEPKFMDNKYVHHGKKYEEIATKVYEELYDSEVIEFGLLNHPSIDFLGASPDGIVSMHTKSDPYKLNERYGRMLEIKCPLTREIKTSGKVDGVICPHYYWVQVQLQLECCKLLECDFWQCTIKEFDTRQEYVCDVIPTNTNNQDDLMKRLKSKPKITKGPIIQLLPIDSLKKINSEWDSKYIYPPTLDRTIEEHDEWILDMMASWTKKYPELSSKYVWDKVIYWKITFCHNVTITHDKEWFANKLPVLESFWDKVIYFRNNLHELQQLMPLINNKQIKQIGDIPDVIPRVIYNSDDEL